MNGAKETAGSTVNTLEILILIRVNGAEREIFSWCLALGEDIEESGFANIWDTNNTNFQVGSHSTNEGLLFRLLNLFGRHSLGLHRHKTKFI